MKVSEMYVEIGAKIDKLESALNRMEGDIKNTGKRSESIAKASFGKIGGMIAGAFSVQAIIQFQKKVMELGAEFQKFEAVLTTSLGSSSLAQGALSMIQSFAAETPFSVRELTGAFVKLTNQGFKPTEREMRKLGDLAASTGKGFDQLAEAIIDAQVGEFERLKEFGVRASAEGDKVKFTFKGVTTEVARTEEAMRGYILSLGETEGVSGSMDAISKTLGGSISNLGDAFDSLLVSISETQGGLSSFIVGASNAIKGLAASIQAGGVLSVDEIFFGESAGQSTFDRVIDGFDELSRKYGSSEAALEKLNEQAQKNMDLAATADSAKMAYYYQQQANAYNRAAVELTKLNQASSAGGGGMAPTKEDIERWHSLGAAANLTAQILEDAFGASAIDISGPIVEMDRLTDPEMEEALSRMSVELEDVTEKLKTYYGELERANMAGELFGSVLNSAFEAALINGESFFETFGNGLKQLIQQLAVAAATSLVLSAILSTFMPGIGFGKIFGQVSGGMGGSGGTLGGIFKLFGTDLVASGDRTTGQQGRF